MTSYNIYSKWRELYRKRDRQGKNCGLEYLKSVLPDTELTTGTDTNLLDFAFEEMPYEFLRAIVKARPNYSINYALGRNHYINMMLALLLNGEFDKVGMLVKKFHTALDWPLTVEDKKNKTLLTWACQKGLSAAVKCLLELGADVNPGYFERSPLNVLLSDHYEGDSRSRKVILRHLLEHKVDIFGIFEECKEFLAKNKKYNTILQGYQTDLNCRLDKAIEEKDRTQITELYLLGAVPTCSDVDLSSYLDYPKFADKAQFPVDNLLKLKRINLRLWIEVERLSKKDWVASKFFESLKHLFAENKVQPIYKVLKSNECGYFLPDSNKIFIDPEYPQRDRVITIYHELIHAALYHMKDRKDLLVGFDHGLTFGHLHKLIARDCNAPGGNRHLQYFNRIKHHLDKSTNLEGDARTDNEEELHARVFEALIDTVQQKGNANLFIEQFPSVYPYLVMTVMDLEHYYNATKLGNATALREAKSYRDRGKSAKANKREFFGKSPAPISTENSFPAETKIIKTAIDNADYITLIGLSERWGDICLRAYVLDEEGNTPLMYALAKQRWNVAIVLLGKYPDSLELSMNYALNNPLHILANFYDKHASVNFLYSEILRSNPTLERASNNSGYTPLDILLIESLKKKVGIKALLERGANPDIVENEQSLLGALVSNKRLTAIEAILDFFKNQPDKIRFYTDVALQERLFTSVIKEGDSLKKIRACLLNAIIRQGWRKILMEALINNDNEAIEALCADPRQELSTIEFSSGANEEALTLFSELSESANEIERIFRGEYKDCEKKKRWKDLFKMLTRTDIVDQKQNARIIHFAAKDGHVPLLKRLFKNEKKPEDRKQEVDLFDSDGSTPLLLAAQEGRLDACLFLLGKGADPRIVNNEGAGLDEFLTDVRDCEKKQEILRAKQSWKNSGKKPAPPNYYESQKKYIPGQLHGVIFPNLGSKCPWPQLWAPPPPERVSGKWAPPRRPMVEVTGGKWGPSP